MAHLRTIATKWTFAATASTGALKAVYVDVSENLTGYFETGPGCTATVEWQTRAGSSAGPYAVLSTANLSTSAVNMSRHLGPLAWVRPYCVAKTTGVLTAELLGN